MPGPTAVSSLAGAEPAAPSHDHVDLVLGVRLLQIDGTDGEDVQARAEVRGALELEVRPVAGGSTGQQLVKLEYLHLASSPNPATGLHGGRG